jgi:hypothetical protein
MRRSYITPEFNLSRVYGTFNMIEESTYFGSKMLDIEDQLKIENQDSIYYQNLKGEQMDYSIESTLQSYVYSPSTDKKENHTLVLDEKQSSFQKDRSAKWILTIDLEKILENNIYAQMKKYRTFEGIKNEMTVYNDVNLALRNYIDTNVKPKYKLKKIDFYLSYKDLRNQNILKWKNTWNSSIIKDENKFNKFQTETAIDESTITMNFIQDKYAQDYSFDYFFNILFEKI